MCRLKTLAAQAMAVVTVFFAGTLHADPLRLDYQTTAQAGGVYKYDFTLTLDNHDGSWAAGQGWDWVIFGDVPGGQTSPIADFAGDTSSLAGTPWTSFDTSSGSHNGPTLVPVIGAFWKPTAVGQHVTWSGTASELAGSGMLKFSTLETTAGARQADFDTANYLGPTTDASAAPLPSTVWAGLGLLGCLGAFKLRRTFAA